MAEAEVNRSSLVARAKIAAQVAAAHMQWGEDHGRLHSDVVKALREAGVPRLFLPAALGGFATDPVTCALVCETLADGDPSAAWFVMVYNSARMMAAAWPAELVERLWAKNPDTLVAASGHTALEGVREGDEVVVSGRNSFVSGCHYADYIMSPVMIEQIPHVVVLPAAQCAIQDNWDTLGMRGTGSNEVVVEQVRVPALQVVEQKQGASQNSYYRDPLYQCPSRVVFATYIPAALSLARRGLNELSNLAQRKVPYASDKKLATRSLAQVHFGKGLADYRAARGYFLTTLEETWQRACAGDTFSQQDRADIYLAGTHAMQTCAQVIRHVADAAGSSVFDRRQPLEKIVRDMETLKHHGFANEARYGSVAQVHWQVELDYPLLLR